MKSGTVVVNFQEKKWETNGLLIHARRFLFPFRYFYCAGRLESKLKLRGKKKGPDVLVRYHHVAESKVKFTGWVRLQVQFIILLFILPRRFEGVLHRL